MRSNGMSLWAVEPESGEVRRLARCSRGYCMFPAWSPDGSSGLRTSTSAGRW